jgi:hypothetical protein
MLSAVANSFPRVPLEHDSVYTKLNRVSLIAHRETESALTLRSGDHRHAAASANS